jgi:hypothetical protein
MTININLKKKIKKILLILSIVCFLIIVCLSIINCIYANSEIPSISLETSEQISNRYYTYSQNIIEQENLLKTLEEQQVVLQQQYNQIDTILILQSTLTKQQATELQNQINEIIAQINKTQDNILGFKSQQEYIVEYLKIYDTMKNQKENKINSFKKLKAMLLGFNITLIILTLIIIALIFYKRTVASNIAIFLLVVAYLLLLIFSFIEESSLLAKYLTLKINDLAIPKLIFGIFAIILMSINERI